MIEVTHAFVLALTRCQVVSPLYFLLIVVTSVGYILYLFLIIFDDDFV